MTAVYYCKGIVLATAFPTQIHVLKIDKIASFFSYRNRYVMSDDNIVEIL